MPSASRLTRSSFFGALMLASCLVLRGQTSVSVGSVADLVTALNAITSNPGTSYALTLTGPLTLDNAHALPAMRTSSAISIDGAGYAIDGGGVQPGFAIVGGSLTLRRLTLQHFVAQGQEGIDGSNGGGGSGGGMGAGGALFVDGGANVDLDTVTFSSNSAVGGTGGAGSYGPGLGGTGAPGVSFEREGAPVRTDFALSGQGGAGFYSSQPMDEWGSILGNSGAAGSFGTGGGGAGASWNDGTGVLLYHAPSGGTAGFGGSQGGSGDGNGTSGAGGVGFSAGGALFVASGTVTFSGPVTFGGGAAANQFALDGGSAIFLYGSDNANGGSGNVVFAPAADQTQTVSDTIADTAGTSWVISGGAPSASPGSWGLTMSGAGTLILGAFNHYSGATMVNSGTLLLNGTIRGPVSVAASAILGGSGSVGGDLSLQSGGVLEIGSTSSGIGTYQVGGNLNASGGSTIRCLLSSIDNTASNITVAKAFAKVGAGVLTFDFQGSGQGGRTYTLASFASTTFSTADFASLNLPSGITATYLLTTTSLQVSLLAPAVSPPVSTTPASVSGTVGTPLGLQLSGSNAPNLFSILTGTLPAGLSIDTRSGQVLGTPTAPGTTSVTFTLGNAGGATTTIVTFQIASAPIVVATASDLISALKTVLADGNNPSSIVFSNSITLGSTDVLPAVSASSSGLTIDGQSHTLDGGSLQRGFTIDRGLVTIENLTLQNLVAAGGAGVGGGGGGLGAGGAIFVGPNAALTLANVTVGAPANPNKAVGGAGSSFVKLGALSGYGGGGGIGGAGGSANGTINGGGGGGFGVSATGGVGGDTSGFSGSAGMLLDAGAGAPGGGLTGGPGGTYAGGGGGGAGSGEGGGGGGTGAYGFNAYDFMGMPARGGAGGFGGGGGGAGYVQSNTIGGEGGMGGFGGGGGAGGANGGGNGGLGGGGGSADGGGTPGTAGAFGGDGTASAGGGGAGLGGGLFVAGSLTIAGPLTLAGNQVAGGAAAPSGNPGSSAGAGLFLTYINSTNAGYIVTPLGYVVTFSPAAGQTVMLSDPIGSDATERPFVINGAGTVVISADNTESGGVVVKQGMLVANATTGSSTGSGLVEVQAGATLAGNGTVTGPVTLDAGAFIAPGNGIGTLTLGSNLSIATGAEILVTLSKQDSTSSKLAVTGQLTTPSPGTYTVNFQGTGAGGTTYTLATFGQTTLTADAFTAAGLPAGTKATFTIANNQLQVTLTATLQAPQITSAASAAGTVGSPFSYTITASNSPTSYGLSGTLPSGLSFNPTTGTLYGTPNQAGTASMSISATNAVGTGSQTLSLSVSPSSTSGSGTGPSSGGSPSSGSTGGGGGGPSCYFGAALALLAGIRAWASRSRSPQAPA